MQLCHVRSFVCLFVNMTYQTYMENKSLAMVTLSLHSSSWAPFLSQGNDFFLLNNKKLGIEKEVKMLPKN